MCCMSFFMKGKCAFSETAETFHGTTLKRCDLFRKVIKPEFKHDDHVFSVCFILNLSQNDQTVTAAVYRENQRIVRLNKKHFTKKCFRLRNIFDCWVLVVFFKWTLQPEGSGWLNLSAKWRFYEKCVRFEESKSSKWLLKRKHVFTGRKWKTQIYNMNSEEPRSFSECSEEELSRQTHFF